ncbi:MAG: hypothetical protein ABJP70_01555 [Erythrobacter sp.]
MNLLDLAFSDWVQYRATLAKRLTQASEFVRKSARKRALTNLVRKSIADFGAALA